MEPFVKKFGESGGLQALEVVGLYAEHNLLVLRNGLVKEGGKFLTW